MPGGARAVPRRPWSVELIPGLACVGVFVAWAVGGGGYHPTSSAPGGLFLLGILALVVIVGRRSLRELPRTSQVALAFFAAFVAWNFLSVSWADVQGIAWDGANRTLLYLIVYAIFTVSVWRVGAAAIVMGTYSVALAVIAMAVLLSAIGSTHPGDALIMGRFSEPADYPNAVSALFIGGFWPAVFLAGRRETPWPARGVLLASAALLLQFALLPQSRGFLIVMPLALVIYLAVVPNRLRALIFMAIVAIPTALATATILDVYTVADSGGDVGAALSSVRDAMFASAIVLLIVGSVVGWADRRHEISERVVRIAGRTTAWLGVAAVICGIVLGIAAVGNPVSWAGDRWDDFKGDYDAAGFGDSRFSGDLGSNRYDFWRVVVEDQFEAAPLVGTGSENFAVTYLAHRNSEEEPLYPHSLPLRILGGTGIVGALLFLGFAATVIAAAVRSRRRASTALARGLISVSITAAAYVILHSSGDWLWSFPAIIGPAFAWLGFASRPPLEPEAAERLDRAPPRRLPRAARLGIAAAASTATIFAILSLVLPWFAARDVEIATASWRSDPEGAFDYLDRARGLNFLSSEADATAGAIASARGDRQGVRESFERVLEREPTNWYALLELGAVAGLEGQRRKALASFDRARKLNPDSLLIRQARRRLGNGNPMTLREIDQFLLERVCRIVGTTSGTRFCS